MAVEFTVMVFAESDIIGAVAEPSRAPHFCPGVRLRSVISILVDSTLTLDRAVSMGAYNGSRLNEYVDPDGRGNSRDSFEYVSLQRICRIECVWAYGVVLEISL